MRKGFLRRRPSPEKPLAPAKAPAGDGLVSLADLRVKDRGEIVRISSRSRTRLARLGAYGVAPGAVLTLLQKRPAFVIRVGETELALDHEVARDILLRRTGSRTQYDHN